jgi:cysteine desulfuration protein SufE
MTTPRVDPLDALRAIPDAHERLMWLTERARATTLTAAERVPANRVPGCVSAVWLVDDSRDGICHFRGDAEAPILRGLVALICNRSSGRPAIEVEGDHTDVVVTLELQRHLTPTRAQGLRALQTYVRTRAAIHTGSSRP